MPKSKRYQWQKNWNVDHDAGTATHESGLMYQIGNSGVVFLRSDKYADAYGDQVVADMGIIKASEHLARLKREAVKLLTKRNDKNGKPIASATR